MLHFDSDSGQPLPPRGAARGLTVRSRQLLHRSSDRVQRSIRPGGTR
jgi:hypothetical protein